MRNNYHLVSLAEIDGCSNEAQDSSSPHQRGKTSNHHLEELDPLRGLGWWRESIWPIPLQPCLCFSLGEAIFHVSFDGLRESRNKLILMV